MFDGLEEDMSTTGDMFVPRSSVKKLVLRPKVSFLDGIETGHGTVKHTYIPLILENG